MAKRIPKPYWIDVRWGSIGQEKVFNRDFDTKAELMKAISEHIAKGKTVKAGYMGKYYD